jgi:hypothetical protein
MNRIFLNHDDITILEKALIRLIVVKETGDKGLQNIKPNGSLTERLP